ncbi:hypothetical protein BV898_03204 [Hypsibius exemplaris]|uniref:Uncharacterized protein n=1 Tax=Hypsibius exemplaris TaxID=2072580 RepID=A0A1W0X5B6_HYPEX|nr:hypothetical protein BV898_03204 [Hypsibius exemplaris]
MDKAILLLAVGMIPCVCAVMDPGLHRVIIPEETTRQLSCEPSHPFVNITSAKYGTVRTVSRGKMSADRCEEKLDYTQVIMPHCHRAAETCLISAKSEDLRKPCDGSVRTQLVVMYSCSADHPSLAVSV